MPQYYVPNISAYLFFSNMHNALALEKDDRRFFVYWSPSKRADESLYGRVLDWYAAGGYAKVARWLMQRDLSGFKPSGTAPDSEHKQDMRRAANGALEDWVETCIEYSTYPFDVDLVNVSDIMSHLPDYIKLTRPSLRSLTHALMSCGAKSFKDQFRLGKKLNTTKYDKVRVSAIRNHDDYINMDTDSLRSAYLAQREKSQEDNALF